MHNEAKPIFYLVIWGEGRCYTVGMWEGATDFDGLQQHKQAATIHKEF